MNIVRNLNLRAIYFETANPASVINKKSDGSDFADATFIMRAADGTITTDPTLAVQSLLDFEPTFDYELEGGWLDLDPTLTALTGNEWFFSCVAVPDVPAAYGGSVEYVNRVNLEMVESSKFWLESEKTAMMMYSAANHTNKIRMLINHPVGAVKRFQIYLQLYK